MPLAATRPKRSQNRSKSFWSTYSCLLLGCRSKTFMENAFDSFMARVEKLWLGSVTDPSRKEKWLAAPALPLSLSPFLSSLRVILARSLSLSLSLSRPLSISVPLYFSMISLSPIFTFSQVPGQIKCSSIEVLNIRQSLLRLQFNQRTCFWTKKRTRVSQVRGSEESCRRRKLKFSLLLSWGVWWEKDRLDPTSQQNVKKARNSVSRFLSLCCS